MTIKENQPVLSLGTDTNGHIASTKPQDLLVQIRTGFSLEDYRSEDVQHYEDWYSDRPDYLDRMFTRSRRYLPYILEAVKSRGMPTEIALLPAIESAFKPDALSSSGASGLWQFIPSTGAIFGLRQDETFDGRQDVILSTRAALDYLEELHQHFHGDWLLALAAYNGGKGYISRAVQSNADAGKRTGFSHLDLRSETRRFIPKLLALRNIVLSPADWNLDLPKISDRAYFSSRDVPAGSSLEDFARSSDISFHELQALNPALITWIVPREGPYRVLVPLESAARLDSAVELEGIKYRQAKNTRPANTSGWRFNRNNGEDLVKVYRVQPGDTLSSISRMFRVSATVLADWNKLSSSHSLSPGQYLRIIPH